MAASQINKMVDSVRNKITDTTNELFSHGPDPLQNTEAYPGDPGLFGPQSVSWKVIGDVSAFIGGIRGLIIQTAHPEVVAGVIDHSTFRENTLERLSRTSAWVTGTTFGAMPEIKEVTDMVLRAHRPVKGTSKRGNSYNANNAELGAWVHNALTDSFLTAYQEYGPGRLSEADADQFVAEQAKVGAILNAAPLPETARELTAWIANHPDIERSQDSITAVQFLANPPLSKPVLAAYKPLLWASVASLPERIREIVDLNVPPTGQKSGSLVCSGLRVTFGESPTLKRATDRANARN